MRGLAGVCLAVTIAAGPFFHAGAQGTHNDPAPVEEAAGSGGSVRDGTEETFTDEIPEPASGYSGDGDAEGEYKDETFVDDYENPKPLASDPAAVKDAHRQLLERKDIQFERPENPATPPPQAKPPGWLRGLIAFLESMGPIFRLLFSLVIGAVILGVLWFIFGEAARVRFGGKAKKQKAGVHELIDVRPDAIDARSLLEEADALARAGRFAEAVHLILFRSITDIQKRLEGGVPRSLTAREIGDLRKIPETARRALHPIIAIVEHSYFGGREVDEAGWKKARASYEDFAFGGDWK
jgi:hypothetical protein